MEEPSQAHAVQKLAFIHKAKTSSVSSLIISAYMKVYDHRIVNGQWRPSYNEALATLEDTEGCSGALRCYRAQNGLLAA